MRLETDDAIHRFQGRWIDANGTAVPIAARYWAWALFVIIAIPLALVLWTVSGGSIVFTTMFTLVGGGLLAGMGADHLGGEYTIGAWFGIFRGERAAWRRARPLRRTKPTRRVAIGPNTPLTTEASKKT